MGMEDVVLVLTLVALIAVLVWFLAGRPGLPRRRDAGTTGPLSTHALTTHASEETLPQEPPVPEAPAADAKAREAAAQAAQQAAWRAEQEAQETAERDAEEAALRAAYEAAEADALQRTREKQAAERQIADAAAVAARRAEAQRLAAERRAAEEADRLVAEASARADAQRVQAERAAAAATAADRAEAQHRADLAARVAAAREAAERAAAEAAAVVAAAAAAAAAATAAPRTPEQTLVMVADDSKVVRVKTSRLLAKQGYRVALAEDGEDALRQFGTELPHLLITDVEMPGMDGFALTRELRGQPHTAQLPIIMITSADDRLRDAAAEAGVTVLMGKPYSEDDLLAQIERHAGITRA